MTSRLSLAVDEGLITPGNGPIVVFGPDARADVSTLPREETTIIQTNRPDYDAWRARGYRVDTEAPDKAALTVVLLSRSKALSRSRIAEAAAVTDGPVVVDGQKTDGIESLLRDVKRRIPVEAVLSKAHGKLFVMNETPDLSDWRIDGPTHTGGYWTHPGTFSSDGPDPGSVLLAGSIPAKLGATIADLGAGWGYLARTILERPDVQTLHLVEAEKLALDCARRNIDDARAQFHWADARTWGEPGTIDTIVSNPPFHEGRAASPALGAAILQRAARLLKPKGQLLLVANRHLPYETHLGKSFAEVTEFGGDAAYKLIRATRPKRDRG